jgi:hypothetical protein
VKGKGFIAIALLLAACRTASVAPSGEKRAAPKGLSVELVSVAARSATLRVVNHSQETFVFREVPASTAAVYETSLGPPTAYYLVASCGASAPDQRLKPGKSVEFSTQLPAHKAGVRMLVGVQHADGSFIVWSR